MRRKAGALLLLLASGAAQGAPISFTREIVPVLRMRCATCHLTGQEAGNIALHPKAAHANLVGVRSTGAPLMRVTPGKPGESYLMMKLEGTHLKRGGSGVRMPFGAPPLDAATLAKFRTWIKEGARAD